YQDHVMLNYGPALSVYSNSLGANLNPLVDDIEVDFSHSFTLGGFWDDPLPYYKFFRTLGNADYYNVVTNNRYGGMLSTIFVFNNHHRNQALGSISLTFDDFTVNYYNDGGAPIDL